MVSKLTVLLCCFIASVLAVPVEKYSDKYDNINIQEIIENKRLIQAYVNCILDRGKCTSEGKALKDHVQDALETGCTKCTKTQEEKVTIMLDHVIKREHDIWKELTQRFDPEGIWRKKYEDRAKSKGIIIPKD